MISPPAIDQMENSEMYLHDHDQAQWTPVIDYGYAQNASHSLRLGLTGAALTRRIGFVCARVAWIPTVWTALAACIDEIGIRPPVRGVRPPKALARFQQVDDAGGGAPVVVVIGTDPERRAALRAGLVVPAVKIKPEIAPSVEQCLAHVASQVLGRVSTWLVTAVDCACVGVRE
jgi:hypothetical protein